jgi:hypothetical protein
VSNAAYLADFIRAKTPKGLRLAMIKNNAKWKIVFSYRDIQFVENDKRWYAWFDVKMADALREEIKTMDGE